MSKVVFVGNVPYNMGEEQLIDVFKSVGQVVGFRLVYDRDSGKPKGYGFCEFADHETAASAVRNLNSVDVGGRPLRIDLADSDPFLEGKTTVRGELLDGGVPGPSEARWRNRAPDPEAFMANLPPGKTLPRNHNVLDAISHTLATTPVPQLMEVLAQMKAFVITHPDQARMLLVKHPQLAYALFQSLLLNGIVDQSVLTRMMASSAPKAGPPPPMARPPVPPAAAIPPVYSYPPPLQNTPMVPTPPPSAAPYGVPPPLSGVPGAPPYYRPPPPPSMVPPPMSAPAPVKARPPGPGEINESQRATLIQIMNLTPEQINMLSESERAAIMQVRNTFMGQMGNPS